ncbi:MAG: YgcG family protein, partial [Deltaproteobacteria bacterium]
MRSLAALLALAFVTAARAAEPPVPVPQGYVTDLAHVIGPDVRARIERLNEELRDKTGAEIAVVAVDTTAPLDDFTYAMRIADAWKPGRKRED